MSHLVVDSVSSGYSRQQLAIRDVSFSAARGEITALLGHNGAGKTTILKTIAGALRAVTGTVSVEDDSRSRESKSTPRFAMVPQGLGVFPSLTVGENIRLGLAAGENSTDLLDEASSYLPILKDRWDAKAGDLSGGQRQMVSIGRALVTGSPLLLLDEPSVGLAPKLVEMLMQVFVQLSQSGRCVVLVEQNVAQSLAVADHVVIVKSGRVLLSDTAANVRKHPDMWSLF